MKRPRPYIPMSVRIKVAQRQLDSCAMLVQRLYGETQQSYLARLLGNFTMFILAQNPGLMEIPQLQLDHDPALILRPFNERTGKYTPDANDPEFLVYLRKADHQQKTTGRKPGALKTITTKGSDIGLKAKFAKLEGRTKRRPKVKIAQRKNPWPKSRKIRS